MERKCSESDYVLPKLTHDSIQIHLSPRHSTHHRISFFSTQHTADASIIPLILPHLHLLKSNADAFLMCIIPLLGGRLRDICAHLYYRILFQQLVLKYPCDLPQDAPDASLLHQIDYETRPLTDHFQGDICSAKSGAQCRPSDRPVCPGVLASCDDADPGHAADVLNPGLDPARRMAVVSVRRRREDKGNAALVVERFPCGVEGDAGVVEAGELDGC